MTELLLRLKPIVIVVVQIVGILLLSCGCSGRGSDSIVFAVIGDYGMAGEVEFMVSAVIKRHQPDFIITVGDNNYGSGSDIDENIGQYYHEYVFPYGGKYGEGSETNRFFPTIGNHDLIDGGAAYLEYFALPGNERYYDFIYGPVHFFALNSNPDEPDGITASSMQALWLQQKLAVSDSPWNVVYFHHAPYSSATAHGSTADLQWPFGTWGATVVIAGHDHTYERIVIGNVVYFVNGVGGHTRLYSFGTPVAGSMFRYTGGHGAMIVHAGRGRICFRFHTADDQVLDEYEIVK